MLAPSWMLLVQLRAQELSVWRKHVFFPMHGQSVYDYTILENQL